MRHAADTALTMSTGARLVDLHTSTVHRSEVSLNSDVGVPRQAAGAALYTSILAGPVGEELKGAVRAALGAARAALGAAAGAAAGWLQGVAAQATGLLPAWLR